MLLEEGKIIKSLLRTIIALQQAHQIQPIRNREKTDMLQVQLWLLGQEKLLLLNTTLSPRSGFRTSKT